MSARITDAERARIISTTEEHEIHHSESVSGPLYLLECTCGWRSEWFPRQRDMMRSWESHAGLPSPVRHWDA